METLRLTVEGKLKWLKELRGGPLTVLLYLWLIGRHVHRSAIDAFFGWDKTTTRKHLRALEDHGLASHVDEVWQLVQAGFQLAIEFRPSDSDLEAPHGVGEISPASELEPDEREKFSRENFSRPSIISIIKDSNINKESINNNNTAARISREKKSPHLSKIAQALAAKHLGVAAGDDDPLPADLRACVDRLVKIGAPRRRAELAVAQSPLSAGVILEQISAWIKHKESAAGRSINPSGFPYLVMARLTSGDVLPTESLDPLARYDGYKALAEVTE